MDYIFTFTSVVIRTDISHLDKLPYKNMSNGRYSVMGTGASDRFLSDIGFMVYNLFY